MGLKFCNEAIIALQQIWPKVETEFEQSPLQVKYSFYNFIHFNIVIYLFIRKP